MSAELNKILCAILSAILVLLLSSFISELLYHPKKSNGKISYLLRRRRSFFKSSLSENEVNEEKLYHQKK